jgi:rubredoxin
MSNRLKEALNHPKWLNHKIGDTYTMDGKPDLWKIAYYPIFECGKTGEVYNEPRALVERPIKGGTDFREIPLRYLDPTKEL